MRILLVEDSARLQRSLSGALRKTGYAVDVASDGEEGLWLAGSHDYDVIVLDIMLPKRDGLSMLAELRRLGRPVHVLLLTARDTVADRVNGLQTGADDYLVKPFALEELLARVQALGRRAYGTKQPRLLVGDLEIDTVARSARRAGQPVDLTAREYLLLEYLARRRGEVVSRADIEAHIYDEHVDPMSNVVDSAICSLRKKIGSTDEAPLIRTRRGLGYVLEAATAAP
ncbi:MAG: Two-component system, OmpR family, copper resistance phosphate regulon response regulator CusR [Lacunisphaera sp.]|nr:Two-component system, OmpR family, copper resistance phosphate regulon response regulator CusR [Lacunisphaera sp.]